MLSSVLVLLDALPEKLIDYPAAGIHAYRTGVPFSVHGWAPQPVVAALAAVPEAGVMRGEPVVHVPAVHTS